jgi:quercetin dioxygenase-like cupin family protein
MTNKIISMKASQAKPFWSKPPHQRKLKVLLSPKIHQTSSLIGMGMVTIAPGESGNLHQHGAEQLTWYILSGLGSTA